MRTLAIDIETFSSIDLTSAGVYAYTSAPDFQILLFGYAWDNEDVRLIDLASGEHLPQEVYNALYDEGIIKTAFNANFERICLSVFFKSQLKADSWRCTAVQAAMLGLPLSLDGVGTALRLKVKKDRTGKDLIKYFSVPCKATKGNGGRARNLPKHSPEKWEMFKNYCIRDVEVEREVRRKIERYPIPDEELKLWLLDQQINDTGVLVDMALVNQAVKCDTQYSSRLESEAKSLTKLDNPNSVAQLKEWLKEQGLEVESLSKQAVQDLLTDADGEIERILSLRQEMAKSSIAKYAAIQRSVCPDNRVRGLFQFYGANRTGRWAGRIFQIQNLPQNHMKDLETARMLVKQGRFKELELFYDSVPIVLSELIRTVLIPETGCRFIVADFSAIEARVLAWLANETWVLETFKGHGKIYEQTASRMFGVPVEKIAKGNPEYELRAKGKVAVLACGYQGGVNALKAMGADKMGLSDTELSDIVRAWRSANQRIVRFWYDIEKAAVLAVREREPQRVGVLRFKVENGILFIILPSGRRLSYIRPRIEKDLRFDKDGLTYEGLGINKQWWRQKTYGGRLVENIVQGTARDCLAEAMLRVDAKGYKIVGHVHDEIITEMSEGQGSLEDLCGIMGLEIPWASGLPLKADGFEARFYKKE